MIRYSAFFPELVLAITAILIIGLDLIFKKSKTKQSFLNWVSFSGVLFSIAIVCFDGNILSTSFHQFLVTDPLAVFGKIIILVSALLTLLMTFRYFKSNTTEHQAEFLVIILFATIGASALTSAQEIITLYVALETLTISSYILAAYMKRDAGSNEAGMKYLLLGAFSSAVLLFGFSYLYGATATTNILKMNERLMTEPLNALIVLGIIFVIAGLSFKISLAPFHMWTPDVYEGAPTPVTAYLSVASKAAGFIAFIRIFLVALNTPALVHIWGGLFAVLAALSIVIGNLSAIPQKNIKRMMAYSSVAQAGYIIIGLLVNNQLGLTAMLFYLFVYLFANMGAFLAIVIVSSQINSEQIDDFSGLWKRSPLISMALLIFMLSLAGVPPFAGFTGKWYLFGAAIQNGYLWLGLLGMIFSVISLYYYLQIVRRTLVLDSPENKPISISVIEKTALIICMLVTIVLGFYATPLMHVIHRTVGSFMN